MATVGLPTETNGRVDGPQTEAQAVKELLGRPVALGYERDPASSVFWFSDGTAIPYWMMVYDIPAMLAHPRVLFPFVWYKAGIANVRFTPKASSSEVGEFALAELTNFWERSLAPAQQVYDYGWLGAEAMYHEVKGLLRYHSMHAFFPLDVWAVTKGKSYRGLNVQNVLGWNVPSPLGGKAFLWGPSKRWPAKALWFTHNRQYDRFYGRSQLYGGWRPFRRLATRDGGEEVADLAFHRFGVGGYTMYYPPAAFQQTTGQGANYDAGREKSREFVETAKAGASLAIPNTRDEKGNRLWEVQYPQHVLDVTPLLGYCSELHKEISCGIGIPPELLEAANTGSGYSGRMIPMIGYFATQIQNARNFVHAFCVQSLTGLLHMNFGPEASCEIKVDLVVPEELTGVPPPGSQSPGVGPGGAPGAAPDQGGGAAPADAATQAMPGGAGDQHGGAVPALEPTPVGPPLATPGAASQPYIGPRGGRWIRNLASGEKRHAELATEVSSGERGEGGGAVEARKRGPLAGRGADARAEATPRKVKPSVLDRPAPERPGAIQKPQQPARPAAEQPKPSSRPVKDAPPAAAKKPDAAASQPAPKKRPAAPQQPAGKAADATPPPDQPAAQTGPLEQAQAHAADWARHHEEAEKAAQAGDIDAAHQAKQKRDAAAQRGRQLYHALPAEPVQWGGGPEFKPLTPEGKHWIDQHGQTWPAEHLQQHFGGVHPADQEFKQKMEGATWQPASADDTAQVSATQAPAAATQQAAPPIAGQPPAASPPAPPASVQVPAVPPTALTPATQKNQTSAKEAEWSRKFDALRGELAQKQAPTSAPSDRPAAARSPWDDWPEFEARVTPAGASEDQRAEAFHQAQRLARNDLSPAVMAEAARRFDGQGNAYKMTDEFQRAVRKHYTALLGVPSVAAPAAEQPPPSQTASHPAVPAAPGGAAPSQPAAPQQAAPVIQPPPQAPAAAPPQPGAAPGGVHLPAGHGEANPLVIGGQAFKSGEFVPHEVLAQATPEQRQALGVPEPTGALYGDQSFPNSPSAKDRPATDEEGYVGQAMGNLMKTSRTAQGVVDTSASAGKAEKIVSGLTGAQAAQHANKNFEEAIRTLYKKRNEPVTPENAMQLADGVAATINRGIVKEGSLFRTDDSPKFPYTKAADLSLARKQFGEELARRLNDPKADPVETAAWIEWRANLCDHFWSDGVGKTSKSLAAIPLMRAGLPLPNYPDNKEFFAHASKKQYDPHLGGQTYLDDSWKRFLDFYRLMEVGAIPGLEEPEHQIQTAARKKALTQYPQLKEDYLKNNADRDDSGALKSVTFNTDEWRELFKNEGYNGANASAVHEPSSYLNKKLLAEMLPVDPARPDTAGAASPLAGKGNGRLMVLAGGGGSGKGTATKEFFDEHQYPIRLDQVTDNFKKASALFDRAKANGFTPEYVFIDRKPEDAWGGVVGRALHLHKTGKLPRTVSIDIALRANIAARRTAIEILEKRPDADPQIIDNVGGDGFRDLITDRARAIEYLKGRLADDESRTEAFQKRAKDELVRRHAAGEIPEHIAHGLMGGKKKFEEHRGTLSGPAAVPPDESAAGADVAGAEVDRRGEPGRPAAVAAGREAAQRPAAAGAGGTGGQAATPLGHSSGAMERLRSLTADQVKADAAYNALPGTMGGKVINADEARELSPEFAGSMAERIRHSRESVKAAGDYAFGRVMREIDDPHGRKSLLILAGGPAAGKSSGTNKSLFDQADLVWDTTLRDPERAKKAIDAALKNGWSVNVRYVHADPEHYVKNLMDRTQRTGRWDLFGGTPGVHGQAQKTVADIARKYGDRVKVDLVHNPFTAPPHEIGVEDVEPGGRHHHDAAAEAKAHAELERIAPNYDSDIVRLVKGEADPEQVARKYEGQAPGAKPRPGIGVAISGGQGGVGGEGLAPTSSSASAADALKPEASPAEASAGGRSSALFDEEDYRRHGVQSKAFKSWFGNPRSEPEKASKVVNQKTGEPLEVFHGTLSSFDKFDKSRSGARGGLHAGPGFYFVEDKRIGDTWSRPKGGEKDTGHGRVIGAYLNIRRPFDFDKQFSREEADGLLRAVEEVMPGRLQERHESGKTNQKQYALLLRLASELEGTPTISGQRLWNALSEITSKKMAPVKQSDLFAPAAGDRVNDVLARVGYDGITHRAIDEYGAVRHPPKEGRDPNAPLKWPWKDYGRVWVAFEPDQIKVANKPAPPAAKAPENGGGHPPAVGGTGGGGLTPQPAAAPKAEAPAPTAAESFYATTKPSSVMKDGTAVYETPEPPPPPPRGSKQVYWVDSTNPDANLKPIYPDQGPPPTKPTSFTKDGIAVYETEAPPNRPPPGSPSIIWSPPNSGGFSAEIVPEYAPPTHEEAADMEEMKRRTESLKLTPDEHGAVHAYQGAGYKFFNGPLRRSFLTGEPLNEDAQESVDALEAAIRKSGPLPRPMTVHRGIGLYDKAGGLDRAKQDALLQEAAKLAESGGVMRLPSFTSTTMQRGRVMEWTHDGKGVHFAIRAKHGLFVANKSDRFGESGLNQERELLLSYKAQYRVEKVEGNTIYLDEVSP